MYNYDYFEAVCDDVRKEIAESSGRIDSPTLKKISTRRTSIAISGKQSGKHFEEE